jgi:solute carrier family 9B (sodium/hydrogen exchanger), member 1/2
MLFSLGFIFLCGLILSSIMKKTGLPGLLGMLITGIALGPFGFDLIHANILSISSELREIALIIILLRAGLALDLKDLKIVGRSAVLMSFIPATLELIAIIILAPILFNISYLDAAIMGTVIAAVSPAVVVPRMLLLMSNGYGRDKRIPQLIMAGASVDDIYVIVLFTVFMGMAVGNGFSSLKLLTIPFSIINGLIIGLITGWLLVYLFKKIKMRDTIKIIIILSVSFLVVSSGKHLKSYLPFSGLLAVMAIGGIFLKKSQTLSQKLSVKFSKLWVGAEILLFVLVGAAVNIYTIKSAGVLTVLLVLSALVFRMSGVFLSLFKTKLNKKEKLFCSISYLPKATVQAAIGAIPLSMGIPAGNLILTAAVISIIITAPAGAIGIDRTYKKFLSPPRVKK